MCTGEAVKIGPEALVKNIPTGHAHWPIKTPSDFQIFVEELHTRACYSVWLIFQEIMSTHEGVGVFHCDDASCLTFSRRREMLLQNGNVVAEAFDDDALHQTSQ